MSEKMAIKHLGNFIGIGSMNTSAVFIFLFLSFSTYVSGASCGSDICDKPALALEVDNWRVTAIIAVMVSALLIAILYMFGKAISDNSLVARSKEEFNQVILNIILVAIVIVIVQFICSNVIPSFLYGSNMVVSYQEPTLIKTSCVYLEKLSELTKSMFYKAFWTFFVGQYTQSVLETKWTKTLGEAFDIILSGTMSLFFSMLISYIISSSQIFLIQFIQPFALVYLFPAGIVLRSLFPFRRFGGALIGIALALFFFLPLLVTLNAVIMDSQFKLNIEIGNKCVANEDCCTGICTNGECQVKFADGETCISDKQCLSGICEETKPSKLTCVPCKGTTESCSSDKDCCKGYKCSKSGGQGYCVLAKELYAPCASDYECTTRVCSNGNCSLPHAADANCSKDTNCYSGKCLGMKCTNCNLATGEIPMVATEGSRTASEGGAISDLIGVDLKDPEKSGMLSFMWQKIKSLFKDIIQPITIVTIAGIVLPLLNLIILSMAVRDMSSFFGAETDISIASIWGIIG